MGDSGRPIIYLLSRALLLTIFRYFFLSSSSCFDLYFFHFNCQSYVSILYLRLPPGFRIILRGKDVERHNIVNDMMLSQEVTYRPNPGADAASKNLSVMLKECVWCGILFCVLLLF